MHFSHFSLFTFIVGVLFSSMAVGQRSHSIDFDSDFYFGIEKVYPSFSLSRADLESAKTLTDLNERYEKDWIAEYYSVDISTWQEDKLVVSSSHDAILTESQQQLILSADSGVPISVTVEYLPRNSLKVNEKKVLAFDCFVEPEAEAKFGSELSIDQYLKSQLVSKVPDSTLEVYDLGAYRFTIDEAGDIIEPTIFWSSGSEWLDALCIDVICNMPNWVPAQYKSGLEIAEEKVLIIGNTQNCIIHTLNLDENKFPKPKE